MVDRVPKLATVGEVAKALGVPVRRVEYVVRSRSISPRATAGGLRCFDDQAIARIRHAITAIDARRQGVDNGH